MHKLLLGALAAVGPGATTAGGVLVAGVVDVGAAPPHSSFTYQALAFARQRAIASRIDDTIWDLAAFLKTIPFLSLPAYGQQLAASGGQAHGAVAGHDLEHDDHEGKTTAGIPKTPPGKSQKTGSLDHGAHKQ